MQVVDPGDGVVAHPLFARPVRAGDEQPVQDADEDRPLNRKLEAAAIEEVVHDFAQPQLLPQPPEQQRPADPHAGKISRLHVAQHHGPSGMARQRGDQPVELAAGLKDVLAAKGADCVLAHPLPLAHALDEVEITVPSGDFFADEHPCVVHPDKPMVKTNRTKIPKCSTTPFLSTGKPKPNNSLFQQLGEPASPQIPAPLLKSGKSW